MNESNGYKGTIEGRPQQEEEEEKPSLLLFLLSFCLLSGLSLPIYESQQEQVFLKPQSVLLSLQCIVELLFFSLFRNLQEKKEEIEVLERKCFSSKVQLESSFLSFMISPKGEQKTETKTQKETDIESRRRIFPL